MSKKIHNTKTRNKRYLKNINKLVGGAIVNFEKTETIEKIYYEGETNSDGIPEGKGTITFKNGNIKYEYTGIFSVINKKDSTAGKFEGKDNSEITCKAFKNDTLKYKQTSNKWDDWGSVGRGKRIYPNGDVYEGTWTKGDDLPKRHIVITYANRNKYEGPYHNNTIDGHDNKANSSQMTYANGDKWVGPLKAGLPNGNGKFTVNVKGVKHIIEEQEWKDGNVTVDGKTYDKDQLRKYYENQNEATKNTPKKSLERSASKSEVDKSKKLPVPTMKDDIGEYYGEIKNGKRNGTGVNVNGSNMYNGQWKDNKRDGEGTMVFANGDKYDGKWKDDKMNGEGIGIYKSGGEYNGDWKDDKRHGRGKYTYKNGVEYNGEWKDDKMNGECTIVFANHDRYEGHWKDDTMNGKGTLIYNNNGGTYKGDWKDGNREGQGIRTYPNGDTYDGNWVNDKANGKGTMVLANGAKYVGNWKDDNREGQGTMIFENGAKYVGDWKDDKINGKGKNTYENGDTYDGEWKDVKRDGTGTLIYNNNGGTYKGAWKDDKRHGTGVRTYDNGDKYQGQWIEGKREGLFDIIFAEPNNVFSHLKKANFKADALLDTECELSFDNNISTKVKPITHNVTDPKKRKQLKEALLELELIRNQNSSTISPIMNTGQLINQLKELRREEEGLHPVLQALENEKAAIVKMRREAEEAAQKKVAEAEAKRQRDRAEAAQREAEEKMQRDRAEALQREAEAKRQRDRAEAAQREAEAKRQRDRAEAAQREAEAKRQRDRAEVERQRAEVERQRAEAAQRAEAQRGEAFANRWRDEYNNSTFSFC
jgi:hypothetical protein